MRQRLLCAVRISFIAFAPNVSRAQTSTADSVRAVANGIIAADNARDVERVMSFYAADAVLMPPNANPVTGHAAIRPRYETLFAAMSPAIVSTLDEVRVAGEWAFVRGKNTGVMRPRSGGGEARALDDVFVMLLQRGADGRWKIARLIWHRASA